MVMIDFIKDEVIKEAINGVIEEYASPSANRENKLKNMYANEVAYWAYKLLEQKHLVTQAAQQTFVDLIIGAALIHNIFIDEESEDAPYMVFEARKKLTGYFREKGLPEDFAGYIFKIVESQYGEDSPIPEVRPTPDTPQAIIATAKFIVNHLEEYDRWYIDTFYPEAREDNE